MKWLHRDKDSGNDDFIQMETTSESANGEVPCRTSYIIEFPLYNRK